MMLRKIQKPDNIKISSYAIYKYKKNYMLYTNIKICYIEDNKMNIYEIIKEKIYIFGYIWYLHGLKYAVKSLFWR